MDRNLYKFKLEKIEFFDFSIKTKPKISNTLFHFDINVDNRVIPEKNAIVQVIFINVREFEKPVVLANISLGIGYFLENIKEVLNIDEEKKSYDMPFQLNMILRGISISTTRGILFSRLMGTYLHNAILPVISLPFPGEEEKNDQGNYLELQTPEDNTLHKEILSSRM